MEETLQFLLSDLIGKVMDECKLGTEPWAYMDALRGTYHRASQAGLDIRKLTSLIRQAAPGNDMLAEAVRQLREEYE